jgi:homoserine kinase
MRHGNIANSKEPPMTLRIIRAVSFALLVSGTNAFAGSSADPALKDEAKPPVTVRVESLDPVDVIRLPVPTGLHVVLAKPDQQLRTRDSRAALPATVPREIALAQAANIAAMVAAAYLDDVARFCASIDDRLAEPARAPLLPGFREAKRAALDAGALACSISGAGPTSFALTTDAGIATRVADAMIAAYASAGLTAVARIAGVDLDGARIL